MNQTNRKMLLIQSLVGDFGVDLRFSPHTMKWYVSASIEIGGDGMLSSPVKHADTPDKAIEAYFDRITNLEPGLYLVTGGYSDRKEWTWNGVVFSPRRSQGPSVHYDKVSGTFALKTN